MSYISQKELLKIGFRKIGKNVQVSDKASIYDPEKIEIGDNSRVDDFCVLSGKIKIGRNVHITVFCNIAGGLHGVELDDYSTLAYGCCVFSQTDDYSGESMTNSTIPEKYKIEKKEKVYIGKFAILGARCCVMPGITIAEGCSFGAMSLVNKSTEPWGVYYGIPALRKSERKKNLLNLVKMYEENDPI